MTVYFHSVCLLSVIFGTTLHLLSLLVVIGQEDEKIPSSKVFKNKGEMTKMSDIIRRAIRNVETSTFTHPEGMEQAPRSTKADQITSLNEVQETTLMTTTEDRIKLSRPDVSTGLKGQKKLADIFLEFPESSTTEKYTSSKKDSGPWPIFPILLTVWIIVTIGIATYLVRDMVFWNIPTCFRRNNRQVQIEPVYYDHRGPGTH